MIKRFHLLLEYLAVTDPDFIAMCPQRERYVQGIQGLSVLLTSTVAFFSGSFGLLTVFDNYFLAVIVGFVWAMIIMNIDRQLISSVGAIGSGIDAQFISKYLMPLLLRFPLALLLGVVISIPVELKFFEKEIDFALTGMEQDRIDTLETAYASRLKAMEDKLAKVDGPLAARLSTLQQQRDVLNRELREMPFLTLKKLRTDRNGNIVTNERGEPRYYEKQVENLAAKRIIRNQMLNIESEIKEIRDKLSRQEQAAQEAIVKESEKILADRERQFEQKPLLTGLLSRYKALDALVQTDTATQEIRWGLRLLIIIIEILPVLMKVFPGVRLYEEVIKKHYQKEIGIAKRTR